MNYKYNPSFMLNIENKYNNLITEQLRKSIDELLEYGQEIDANLISCEEMNILIKTGIAVKIENKMIFNPSLFIF